MRTFSSLSRASQARLSGYIRSWMDVPSQDLAGDLQVSVGTVRAVKANATRELGQKFNELLGG